MSRSILVFLALWEGLSRSFSLGIIWPAPSSILQAFFQEPAFYVYHSSITLMEMLAGMLLATSVAFPLGILMKAYPRFQRATAPLVVTIQCVPMFALAPMLILIFGWTSMAVVVATALMIFLPLTLGIYQGLCHTPRAESEMMQILGATPWQRFCYLELPSACPHIVSGFRISVSVAGIGAIGGEWAGAQEGLGMLIMELRQDACFPGVFVAISLLALMTYTLYLSLQWTERLLPKGPPCAFSPY